MSHLSGLDVIQMRAEQRAHRVRLRIIRIRGWRGRTRDIDKRVSSALISPERRRLPTTTVLFLFFYFVLAPETLRTSVEGRTITHIQRKRNGRFVRLILFGLLGLTYRGVSVRGRGINDAGENGRRGEKGKKIKMHTVYASECGYSLWALAWVANWHGREAEHD